MYLTVIFRINLDLKLQIWLTSALILITLAVRTRLVSSD